MEELHHEEATPFSTLAKFCFCFIGVITFPLMHALGRIILTKYWPWMSNGTKFRISTRLVSALQSIMVVFISARTVITCKNILTDQDPWLHAYIWFGLSYFLYDVIVMYTGHCFTHELMKNERKFVIFFKTLSKFFQKECIMVMHHFILLFIGFPVVEFYKKGLGDFFVGCFFLAEISTPFYSLKGILKEIDVKTGMIYEANGLIFMVTFLIGRVLSVPYMYWRYAHFSGLPLSHVPFKVPLKCNILSLSFSCLQCYWFSLICSGIYKHFNPKRRMKSDLKDRNS